MNIPAKALAIGAAVIVVAGATFGAFRYASAQEGSPTPSTTATANATPGANAGKRQQAVDAFLAKVAANLNISPDTLKAAMKNAGLQTVDDLVGSGKLTPDQATKLKAAINSGKYPELSRLFKRRAAGWLGVEKGIIASSAKAMNIAPKDLVAELKAGKSVAQVAAERNASLDTVKSQITTDAQAKLNTAVQDKRISQAQADAAMQKLTANLDTILNRQKGDKQAPVASATPGA
ncbi:MAG: hypothetical protein IVW36_07300 [Dehalococcoidia bacterium]|nr:hypothetical protein [Dehalococcoidia bacterium]